MTKILFKIFTLFIAFNGLVLANINTSEVGSNLGEIIEVSLDSFSGVGILLMIVLTSLLGLYFLKDEFPSVLD